MTAGTSGSGDDKGKSSSKRINAPEAGRLPRKRQKTTAATGHEQRERHEAAADGDVEALKARLLALESENRRLREQAGEDGAGQAAMDQDGEVLSKTKAKKLALHQKWAEKKKRRKAAKATKTATEAIREGTQHAAAQETPASTHALEPAVDMTAWHPFALHPLLEQGLALQGFSRPTEIQAAVLPAACRDCADIIGAAQTGSGKTLAFGLPIMQRLLQVGTG